MSKHVHTDSHSCSFKHIKSTLLVHSELQVRLVDRPSSAFPVNGQGAAGANLCVSSPLVWHQNHGIILAETVPSPQHDPGIT